jgi:hypothetical protein
MTVGEDMTFDEIDQLGQVPGLVTQNDLMTPSPMPMQSAVAPSPFATQATAPASGGSFMNTITSILQSGAQAYGAYSAARAPKKAAPMMPMNFGPSVAPTTPGMSGTTLALLIGGGVLVLGVGALLIFKK